METAQVGREAAGAGMSAADECRIDPAVVAELYAKHEAELRFFLIGVLRDVHLANDALQTTFAKAIEVGHRVMKESLKGWLFRVALNEALAIRRRRQTSDRLLERVAWFKPGSSETPVEQVARSETVDVVRAALNELPTEQRQVVYMRIYEGKTFAKIADEMKLPLGTVLTRMQLAVRKLRHKLEQSSKGVFDGSGC
jgi:RNA polymerase sigma factor (sigma-70 family)